MNTVTELTRLSLHRPGADAGPQATADWYRAKARVLFRLAAESGTDAARLTAYAEAAAAHARAARYARARAAAETARGQRPTSTPCR